MKGLLGRKRTRKKILRIKEEKNMNQEKIQKIEDCKNTEEIDLDKKGTALRCTEFEMQSVDCENCSQFVPKEDE